MKQKIIQNVKVIVICLIIAAGVSYASADWSAPLSSPPTCITGNPGCDAPLNGNSIQQDKLGGLRLNTGIPQATNGLQVWGNSIFNGPVKINTGNPTAGQILTSTDASGTVAWQSSSPIPSNIVVFDTPGTTNWTAPAGVTRVRVRVWGGGAGGAFGWYGQPAILIGPGGGAGGYAESIVSVTNTTYAVTVGAGGAGSSAVYDNKNGYVNVPTASTVGHDGGNSSFANLVSANGGWGSTHGTIYADGENGGTASGTIAIIGGFGHDYNDGTGGDSPMGGSGGIEQSAGVASSMTPGVVPGGGGAGGNGNMVGPANGGAGAHGRVIVEY